MEKLSIQLFENDHLNDVATELIELDNQYQMHIEKAEESLYSAFETRWKFGKLIHDNEDLIKEICGTQKEFARITKKSEGVISNNKRAYRDLLKEGCETFDDVVDLLENRSIKPTIRNFEKIGNLLNEPQKDTKQIEQYDKDLNRLNDLSSELEEILRRNEPANKPEVYEEAFSLLEDVTTAETILKSYNPKNIKWNSEKYLDHVRNFGRDLITMEPCEKCDPHHTTPEGGTGGTGTKLPDFFTIPVSRNTHTLIGLGYLQPTPEDILRAQFITLTSFLYLNMKTKTQKEITQNA